MKEFAKKIFPEILKLNPSEVKNLISNHQEKINEVKKLILNSEEKIGEIVKLAKNIRDKFKNSAWKKIKDAVPIKDNSSAEDVNYVMQGLIDFKESINEQLEKVEELYEKEIEMYFEELNWVLQEKKEKLKKYGINFKRINRKIERVFEHSKGNLKFSVSKKLSLDNAELRGILKMMPGLKRDEALDSFIENILHEALSESCEKMKTDICEVCDEVEDTIFDVMETVQVNCKTQAEKLENIESDDSEQMKDVIYESYYNLFVCDLVDTILREG